MSVFSMFVVYILTWWVVLFMILPLGVRGQAETDDITHGSEPGAPVTSDIKKKFITTTWVSFIIWVVICGLITSGVIKLSWFGVEQNPFQ